MLREAADKELQLTRFSAVSRA